MTTVRVNSTTLPRQVQGILSRVLQPARDSTLPGQHHRTGPGDVVVGELARTHLTLQEGSCVSIIHALRGQSSQ